MNETNPKYSKFALCREMMETPDVMRRFDPSGAAPLISRLEGSSSILLTGEGSSRIFPAKRTRAEFLRNPIGTKGPGIPVIEGATQAMEYDLSEFSVLGTSNSGRTRELVRLFKRLKAASHKRLAGITAFEGTPLADVSDDSLVLACGPENAVAATKSVVEQAMVIQAVMSGLSGAAFPDHSAGADAVAEALSVPVPPQFAQAMAGAGTVYFAGRNDGVAEELTLKTNEIVRKRSDFLEGTYAAHGIEEIMMPEDVVILIDPFEEEEAKLADCLGAGVGVKIFAIADRPTSFPTLRVPAKGPWKEYVLLTAGWNLLVEAGLEAGVDLDKPERARKVGNEV